MLTVSRNSPGDAQLPAGGRRWPSASGGGQVIGAARHHRDPAVVDAHRPRSAATSRDGTTSAAPGSAGPPQRRLVPARAAPRRRLGMPAPRHVVHRHDQTAPGWSAASWGEASETEWTTSNPPGARDSPWSQARVRSGPGSRDACSGRPKPPAGRARPARGPAGQEGHLDPVALRGRNGQAAEQAARVGPDAAGHTPPQLLDGQQHRGCRRLSHGLPPHRDRGLRDRRRNAPMNSAPTRPCPRQ